MEEIREMLMEYAAKRNVPLANELSGLDDLEPLFASMMDEGAVIIIKMDGERSEERFDAFISGGGLGRQSVRAQGETSLEAMCRAIVKYAGGVGWMAGAWSTRAPS